MIRGSAFAGEFEPVTVGMVPLADLGKVTLSVSDLQGPAATIPARMIDVRYVSYRVSRVTPEGSVYTISPRLILPGGTVQMPKDLTRRFWLTVRPPPSTRPGDYRGTISIHAGDGRDYQVPLEFQVRAGTLDPVDIPAGPFGHAIGIPWYQDDPRAGKVQPADGRAEPAANASLRVHRLHRPAVDFLPRLRQGETDP